MHRKSFAFCCYGLLLIVASLEFRGNSTSDNITIQYESYLTFMENEDIERKWPYKWRENITKDNNDNNNEYKFPVNSMKKEIYDSDDLVKTYEFFALKNHEQDNRMTIDANSTHAEDENYSISYEFQNFNEDNNNSTRGVNNDCIQLCCPLDKHLVKEKCENRKDNYSFPIIDTDHIYMNDLQETKSLDQMFHQINIHDLCQNKYIKNANLKFYEIDNLDNIFFKNDSLYHCQKILIQNYCVDIDTYNVHRNKYEIKIYHRKTSFSIHITVGVIISVPFLLATFVIYSILPEMQNMHGYTLRAHVISLFVSYVILAVYRLITLDQLGYTICLILALFLTFFSLASFCWLNVICFDIWWTFRKQIYLSQGKQQKGKKFMYALYGWGCPFVLIIVYVMIDCILVPKDFIRPEFCICTTWISDKMTRMYYFFIPMGITIVCNIYLFISMILMMARHKKDTGQHLRHSVNKYQNNKQWFKMYIKLFLLMGITWIMEIVSDHLWLIDNNSLLKSILEKICSIPDMINALQGVIIFIIFVCKKKIKLLLMKRLGYQNHILCGNPTNSDCHSTTASITISMQSINSCVQELPCEQSVSNEITTQKTK